MPPKAQPTLDEMVEKSEALLNECYHYKRNRVVTLGEAKLDKLAWLGHRFLHEFHTCARAISRTAVEECCMTKIPAPTAVFSESVRTVLQQLCTPTTNSHALGLLLRGCDSIQEYLTGTDNPLSEALVKLLGVVSSQLRWMGCWPIAFRTLRLLLRHWENAAKRSEGGARTHPLLQKVIVSDQLVGCLLQWGFKDAAKIVQGDMRNCVQNMGSLNPDWKDSGSEEGFLPASRGAAQTRLAAWWLSASSARLILHGKLAEHDHLGVHNSRGRDRTSGEEESEGEGEGGGPLGTPPQPASLLDSCKEGEEEEDPLQTVGGALLLDTFVQANVAIKTGKGRDWGSEADCQMWSAGLEALVITCSSLMSRVYLNLGAVESALQMAELSLDMSLEPGRETKTLKRATMADGAYTDFIGTNLFLCQIYILRGSIGTAEQHARSLRTLLFKGYFPVSAFQLTRLLLVEARLCAIKRDWAGCEACHVAIEGGQFLATSSLKTTQAPKCTTIYNYTLQTYQSHCIHRGDTLLAQGAPDAERIAEAIGCYENALQCANAMDHPRMLLVLMDLKNFQPGSRGIETERIPLDLWDCVAQRLQKDNIRTHARCGHPPCKSKKDSAAMIESSTDFRLIPSLKFGCAALSYPGSAADLPRSSPDGGRAEGSMWGETEEGLINRVVRCMQGIEGHSLLKATSHLTLARASLTSSLLKARWELQDPVESRVVVRPSGTEVEMEEEPLAPWAASGGRSLSRISSVQSVQSESSMCLDEEGGDTDSQATQLASPTPVRPRKALSEESGSSHSDQEPIEFDLPATQPSQTQLSQSGLGPTQRLPAQAYEGELARISDARSHLLAAHRLQSRFVPVPDSRKTFLGLAHIGARSDVEYSAACIGLSVGANVQHLLVERDAKRLRKKFLQSFEGQSDLDQEGMRKLLQRLVSLEPDRWGLKVHLEEKNVTAQYTELHPPPPPPIASPKRLALGGGAQGAARRAQPRVSEVLLSSPRPTMRSSAFPQSNSALHEAVSRVLPSDWVAVALCIDWNASMLYVTRMERDKKPAVCGVDVSEGTSGLRAIQEWKTALNSWERDHSERKPDYSHRHLDQDLQRSLKELETEVFGCWKSLLMGGVCDREAREKVKELSEWWGSRLTKRCARKNPDLPAALMYEDGVEIDQALTEALVGASFPAITTPSDKAAAENLQAASANLLGWGKRMGRSEMGTEETNLLSAAMQELREKAEDFLEERKNAEGFGVGVRRSTLSLMNEYRKNRQHVILIPDATCSRIAWEGMPCLRQASISRVPSLMYLFSHLTDPPKLVREGVDPKSSRYLLDPNSDCSTINHGVQNILDGLNIEGWYQTLPEPDELRGSIQENDVWIYGGHGSSANFHKGKHLPESGCGVVLESGCKAGMMQAENEDLDPEGPPLRWLLAGSPCVVAPLWSVLGQDTARVQGALVREWMTGNFRGTDPSPLTTCQALARARSFAKYPHATGAAYVCYGFPVRCKFLLESSNEMCRAVKQRSNSERLWGQTA